MLGCGSIPKPLHDAHTVHAVIPTMFFVSTALLNNTAPGLNLTSLLLWPLSLPLPLEPFLTL